jgi:uridine kinase
VPTLLIPINLLMEILELEEFMKGKLPIVISIAAVSGGGKTTISTNLEEKLKKSKTIFFDDYDFDGPNDMIEWIEHGSNPDEWDLSPLIKDIKKLLIDPLDYIILDFPFAYLHSQTREFIDYTVFIDTPLDVALARRIIRDFKDSPAENILLDLENYLDRGRRGYLTMLKTTKPNSDLIVDGTLPISEIVNTISHNLLKSD